MKAERYLEFWREQLIEVLSGRAAAEGSLSRTRTSLPTTANVGKTEA